MQLSTVDPQIVHILCTVGALLAALGCTLFCLRLRQRVNAEFPGRSEIARLTGAVAELDGELGALRDRFSRFQKREGMRAAREEKTSQKDLLEEAKALVAQGASPAGSAGQSAGGRMGKAELYRRRFNS